MEEQDQSDTALFNNSSQLVSQETEVIGSGQQKRRILNKKNIIIGAVLAVLIGAIIGIVALKFQADAAAKQYAKDIDTHFSNIFSENNLIKRDELIKNQAVLRPVFLGSIVSQTYSQMANTNRAKYTNLLDDSAKYTKMKIENGDFIRDVVADIQDVLKTANAKIDLSTSADPRKMESTLLAMLEKADRLNQIADEVDNISGISKYKDAASFTANLRSWSVAQYGVVQEYVSWTSDLTEWGYQSIKDVFDSTNKVDSLQFDEATYQKRIDVHVADYSKYSNRAVDDLNGIVDQILNEPLDSNIVSVGEKLNKDTAGFRAELAKIIK